MFPSRERLKREDFPAALAAGHRFSSAHFKAIIPAKASGYAVIVSKKVARLSVTRHQIKRRVLGALKGVPLPSSVILYPRASVLDMGYDALQRELIKLLS